MLTDKEIQNNNDENSENSSSVLDDNYEYNMVELERFRRTISETISKGENMSPE